jgi:hygromycin-B 7''-O-kinase
MTWVPPVKRGDVPLRAHGSQDDWREPIEIIARQHGLWPCELTPFERGETIVWRAGEHVIKLTIPECKYQIEAEVGCLGALAGKLSVATPRLHAHGALSGWPYVIMQHLPGRPLAEEWPRLAHEQRRRLAHDLGTLCRQLHRATTSGFRSDWTPFWESCLEDVEEKHAGAGGPAHLLAGVAPFLEKLGPLDGSGLVPVHTELTDGHVYVDEIAGKLQLSGLIDFADARLAPPLYEFASPIEFIFKGEPGLLRAFLLAYGLAPEQLTQACSETLLGWLLCHRFSTLGRLLGVIAPRVPDSIEELASLLCELSTE